MSSKSKKKENKFRLEQQLASKFPQKSNGYSFYHWENKDKKAVKRLANKLNK